MSGDSVTGSEGNGRRERANPLERTSAGGALDEPGTARPAAPDPLDALVAAVGRSAHGRYIASDFVRSVGATELARAHDVHLAAQATKDRIHEVSGAFDRRPPRYERWLSQIAATVDRPGGATEACRAILMHHASTEERGPDFAGFYARLWDGLPPVRSVLDLGCGLNPLAAVFFPADPPDRYVGVDLRSDRTEFLQRAYHLLGRSGEFRAADVRTAPLSGPFDVALLLKLLPSLERLEPGSAARLLARVPAATLIVSFPAHGLGRHTPGWGDAQERWFHTLLREVGWTADRIPFRQERVFRIRRGAPS